MKRKPVAKKVSSAPEGIFYFMVYGSRKNTPTFVHRTLKEVETTLTASFITDDNYDVYEVEVVNVRKLEKKVCWAGEEEDCG